MEIFAHDLSSLSYFCRELGRPSGEPALARMIEDGVLVLCESRDLIDAAREIAHTTINTGPLALGEGSLDALRYGITDLAEALRDPLSSAQQIAIGNSLYAALTTFAFRAGGHWSASGKALPSALSTVRPALADQFTDVFERFYVTGEATALQGLVDDILTPYWAGSATDSSRKHRYLGAIIPQAQANS